MFICRSLGLGSEPLLVGGVRQIATVLNHTGQVSTHDFIGCVQNFTINTEDMLRQDPVRQANIESTCPRTSSDNVCEGYRCENGGTCVKQWAEAVCYCTPQYMGPNCQTGRRNFVTTSNHYISWGAIFCGIQGSAAQQIY